MRAKKHERVGEWPKRHRWKDPEEYPDPLFDLDVVLIERLIDLRADLEKTIRGTSMKEDYEELAALDLVSITYSPDRRMAKARITEKGQHWIDLHYAAGPQPGYLEREMPVRGRRGKRPVFKKNQDVSAAKQSNQRMWAGSTSELDHFLSVMGAERRRGEFRLTGTPVWRSPEGDEVVVYQGTFFYVGGKRQDLFEALRTVSLGQIMNPDIAAAKRRAMRG